MAPESQLDRPAGLPMLRLLRPKQWSKNLLVFAALIFTGRFRDVTQVLLVLQAFASMSLVSSATYVFNDLRDVDRDRRHPKKKFRPIASGAVSAGAATVVGFACLFAGVALGWMLGKEAAAVLLMYLVIQFAYNAGLKRAPVADVYAIAIGFVLRAVLGAAALHVMISGWLLFCTGALALMLGFAKRRHEFILQGEDRESSRESLVHYNRPALDALVLMFACASALCYGIYSLQSLTAAKYPSMILTSPFVFYGITRYVLVVFTADEGGEPEELIFRDPHIVTSIVLFLAAAALALSGFKLPIVER